MSIIFPPLQTAAVAGEIEAVKVEATVTVPEAAAVHPLASVTVTLYTVVEEGFTVILAVVAPVFHE